jgi:glutaminyl-tRNA synthetase
MTARRQHFLTDIIDADLAAGRVPNAKVVTRFPPEPNGYLHLGHCKSICLNFGLARDYGGACNLRMDDTNPITEDIDYVEAIARDVAWLGFQWQGETRFASDYFGRMYDCAERLIRQGDAYVDSQSVENLRAGRGDFGRPGLDSPFRQRSVAENLDLFRRMRAGEFPDGSHVLRARIDMAHPNMILRDPLLYRIRHAHHHRTGDDWCIYPMYDYAHPLEDAFEGVTHSICTLEFESNRELYDWVLDRLGPWSPRPRQYEFARLALGYTLMSKRKLLQLVEEGQVSGWADPRMPTLAGMRRRGVTPEALREFADLVGVAKNNSLVDIGKLEFCIRQDLEQRSARAMAVLHGLPVVVTNYPEEVCEWFDLPWHPGQPERGTRKVPFSRELYIERDDFAVDPPADWKRLAPGREVRLYGAYFLRCDEVVADPATGEPMLLRCSYDPSTKGGEAADGRQPAGTLHWVDAARSTPVEVRLYDRLFRVEQPEQGDDFRHHLNPDSLVVVEAAHLELGLNDCPDTHVQFVRLGYFCRDVADVTGKTSSARGGNPEVWNRVIGLRDTWAKPAAKQEGRPERQPRTGNPQAPRDPASERQAAHVADPQRAERFHRWLGHGVAEADADRLAASVDASDFGTAALEHAQAGSVARWLLNDLSHFAQGKALTSLSIDGSAFGRFVAMVDGGTLTPAAGKTLLGHLVAHGGEPRMVAHALGLLDKADDADVREAVDAVLAAHPAEATRFLGGERKLIGLFVGAAMRQLKGAAEAGAVRSELERRVRG